MMNLKTKVAVTGVTNLHDARYCAGTGVDWVGFPIDPSLGQAVSKEDFAEITGWVTGPLFLGEVGKGEAINLADFQVDGFITDNPAILQQFGSDVPIAWRINLATDSAEEVETALKAYEDLANWFLLESSEAPNALNGEWLQSLCLKYPIVLACDFTPESANTTIDDWKPLGIGLKAGKELKVGLNDFDGLADVLEAIELED